METSNRQTSAITPEMINQYRQLLSLRQDEIDWLHDTDWRQADAHFGNYLMAFTKVQPFIIRFEQEPRPNGRSPVAYLAVVGGAVQWRYSPVDPGYERCPVVQHRSGICQLDELFMRYYRQNQLPDALQDERQHLSERLVYINTYFFAGAEKGVALAVPEDKFMGKLVCDRGVWLFVSHLVVGLGIDRYQFRMKWIKTGRQTERVLSVRFGWEERFVDVGMPGSLYLQLLLCLNEIFWPHYQIRRYRDGNTGPGGVLPMLSGSDWERLEALHGRDAVHDKFEHITPKTEVNIPTDERGNVICGYDKASGL